MNLATFARNTCALGLLLALGGCGYSAGNKSGDATKSYQWKSLYRPGIKTVAVSVFTSREFDRYDEIRFTQALAKNLEAYTPYKIASRDVADTVSALLRGSDDPFATESARL